MNAYMVLDIVNFVITIFLVWMMIMIVLRTEKGLDKVFKLLLVASVIFLIKNMFELNNEIGLFSFNVAKSFSIVTRFFITLFLSFSAWTMLGVIKKESKNECKVQQPIID